ncbi:MAG: hypothetical protein QXH00_06445 [Candidatus Jordarchaeales archaeon]
MGKLEQVLNVTVVIIITVVVFSAYLAHRFLQQAESSWSMMLLPFFGGVAALFFTVALLVKEMGKNRAQVV